MESLVRTVQGYSLTPQMNNFVDAVVAGLDVKGSAFAGTGKSSTLKAVEKYHTGKRCLYICYNKAFEAEAKETFTGNNVDIFTSHAFSLKSYSKAERDNYITRISKQLSYNDFLKYTSFNESGNIEKLLNITKSFRVFTGIAIQFIASASEKLTNIHITDKVNNLIDQLVKNELIKSNQTKSVNNILVKHSGELAKAMISPGGDCPTTHDAYVKNWQLSKPVLNYDYIMFDEAQDANPVLLHVILSQKCQKIFVGDKFQSIYQFRGSVNAMDILPFEDFPFSCSFRYGQSIANLASKILNHINDVVKITGKGFNTKAFKGSEYQGT